LTSRSNSKRLRTHYASQLKDSVGKEVRIAGWVEDLRAKGSITFLTIRDVTGLAQAVFKRDELPEEEYSKLKKLTLQSVVSVRGIVGRSLSKKLEFEVKAKGLELVSKALHPLPLDPRGRIDAGLDKRLDSRALDLRNPKNLAIFKLRHALVQSIRAYLISNGFIEVSTPKLIGTATEGGADLFEVDYFGRKAYLAQSPQLYKEQLVMSLDRVFEMADYFRAEKSSTRRHLSEFYSVDVEAAFMDEEDVMELLEGLIRKGIEDVSRECSEELKLLGVSLKVPEVPFERITYDEAVEELKALGVDKKVGDDLLDSDLKVLGSAHKGFYFITKWPVGLKPFYIERIKEEPEYTYSFDLQHGYLEIASGGRRVHDRAELERRLRECGLDVKGFEEHLKVFGYGMPPHSGWGLGLDRLMMVLTGRKNIREVTLYPRDRFRLVP